MEQLWSVNRIDANTAEIIMYGYIGGDKMNASDFAVAFKSLENNCATINLRVNSGGGSIFEGLAIFNTIRQSKCAVDAYIDGLCASMMSIVVLACKNIYMSKNAMLMTHRPSGAASGNPAQLRSTADMLEDLEKTLCTIYAERTGLSEADAKARYLGAGDNWMTATEALDAKIIDGIYDAPPAAQLPPAEMRSEQDLINFFTNSFTKTKTMDFKLSADAATALGLDPTSASATDPTAINSAIAGLARKAAKVDTLTTELATEKQKVATMETAANTAKVEGLVDTAIAAVKIVPGDRNKYIKLATADFETTKELIDAMKPYSSVKESIGENGNDSAAKAELAELVKMSGRDLYMGGKFERLKQLDMEQFKAKYKEYYGHDYKA